MALAQALWRRDPAKIRSIFNLMSGKRIYAIWSARDPLPSIAYMVTGFIPKLIATGVRVGWSATLKHKGATDARRKNPAYEGYLGKEQSRG
jgi:hypothetical protein